MSMSSGGMSLVPAPHRCPVVLQDQSAGCTAGALGTVGKRWAPCNADHPPVLSRACPQSGPPPPVSRPSMTGCADTSNRGRANAQPIDPQCHRSCHGSQLLLDVVVSRRRPVSSAAHIRVTLAPHPSTPRLCYSLLLNLRYAALFALLPLLAQLLLLALLVAFLPEQTLQSESRDPPSTASSHKPQLNNARSTACPNHGRRNGKSGPATPTVSLHTAH